MTAALKASGHGAILRVGVVERPATGGTSAPGRANGVSGTPVGGGTTAGGTSAADDAADAADAAEAVVAGDLSTPSFDGNASTWPDENAEASFISDARERGEPVKASVETVEAVEDDSKPLPPMADLVKRLSPEIRETLDELFRAKFTTVRKTPKKWFKEK